jgi:Fe2+ transport system protein FeoA
MPPDAFLPMEMLHNGESGEIADICGESTWVHRLAELGVRAGCQICVLQGGSPCLVQIGGVRICLRSDDATHILVRPHAFGTSRAVS